MKINNSFFLFHLNLAFSSIENSLHDDVINKCYFPLLEKFSTNDIKLAILNFDEKLILYFIID